MRLARAAIAFVAMAAMLLVAAPARADDIVTITLKDYSPQINGVNVNFHIRNNTNQPVWYIASRDGGHKGQSKGLEAAPGSKSKADFSVSVPCEPLTGRIQVEYGYNSAPDKNVGEPYFAYAAPACKPKETPRFGNNNPPSATTAAATKAATTAAAKPKTSASALPRTGIASDILGLPGIPVAVVSGFAMVAIGTVLRRLGRRRTSA